MAHGKSRVWAAGRLQTTEASLSRILQGKQWPSREFFERVDSLTKGQVTAEHFVSPTKRIKSPKGSASGNPNEAARQKVRVQIDEELLADAAELGMDVKTIAEALLREKIKEEKIKRWQAEHADVIAWYNEHIEKDGVFGGEWRTF